jgi:hypothetical protein
MSACQGRKWPALHPVINDEVHSLLPDFVFECESQPTFQPLAIDIVVRINLHEQIDVAAATGWIGSRSEHDDSSPLYPGCRARRIHAATYPIPLVRRQTQV